ncbi:MAG TPA: redox-regulated ATPase YchF [Candidatus Magasanikbacteria bacterium]|nr:redox-regulated ATPase YchF [Candidatus Magasanikbacteria bacterium]
MLSLGIVGLPNVGKSTLFNALTRSKQADAQNYPFCTIEPNVGVVEVPDERLAALAAVSKSAKVIPAAIKFIDIAGIVKGASEGEGLGNKFLSHIREVDAIVQVVRAFRDDNVIHVANRVNPNEDADVINLELVLADWQTVSKSLNNAKKGAKGAAAKGMEKEIQVLDKIYNQLEAGKPARDLEFDEEEMKTVRDLHLLTMKPMLYVINVDEYTPGMETPQIGQNKVKQIAICAKLEAELAELSPEESKTYLAELGIKETGLDRLIVAGYELLELLTYLTSGEPETRAWTVRRGTAAPDAAGVIHTDFVKGFVKAEVTNWRDFVEFNGWPGVKTSGKMRLEGKDYIMQDGDVCYFHIA